MQLFDEGSVIGQLQRIGQTLGNPAPAPTPTPPMTKTVPVADPAAGNNWSVAVPSSVTWKVKSITFRLVSDANASNRLILLQLQDASGVIVAQVVSPVVLTASQTITSTYGPTLTLVNVNPQANFYWITLPVPDITMDAYHVSTITMNTNLQVGDQFSGISIVVEETSSYQAGTTSQAPKIPSGGYQVQNVGQSPAQTQTATTSTPAAAPAPATREPTEPTSVPAPTPAPAPAQIQPPSKGGGG